MFLYLRMLVSIAVNLYTVRVLWNVLGVDDYGIFNVVGGIVKMFAFLNNAMVASSQRYISFSLGKGDILFPFPWLFIFFCRWRFCFWLKQSGFGFLIQN